MLTAIFVYMFVGAIAGLLAGLLGVGGGLVIVPMITYAMALQGIATPYSHHIALGTSLASIIFTSVSSFMAHHRNKAVQWHIVRQVTVGILVGTFVGSKVATLMPIVWLKGFFIIFLYYVATQMVLNIKPSGARTIPGIAGNSLAGSVIGFVSSLVGIGGGTLSVPYMTWCNVPMRNAIGTSAAIGFPIAIAGALGYVFNGLGKEALPAYTLGFIYLPALAGITVASVCTAPFGAKLAHTLPIPKLKRYFALLLYVVATQMLYSLVR